MKVLLTTPPQAVHSILPDSYKPMHEILSRLNGNRPILGIQPPYGLMYLSAYLKERGHHVILVDGLLSSKDQILAKIREEKIDIVGISSVSWNWSEAKEMARLVRSLYPEIKLAAGGAHVNGEKGRVLEDCAYFDYAFYGDAEESFRSLLESLSTGTKPEAMDGFAFRDESGVIASDRHSIIKDINRMLLPDRDSLGLTNYRPAPLSYRKLPYAGVFGARGCPYQCTFCHTDKHIRMRSAENIVKEIELLQEKYGVQEVAFFDDTFTLDKKRIFEFSNLLLDKKIKLSWTASIRSNTITPEMLKIMKKAGCWRLLIGIESGSERILRLMKKGQTPENVYRAVDMIYASGIQTYGMFIFGMPSETYLEGLETIKFMKALKLDYISVCGLTPFPGTEIYEMVAKEPGFKGFNYMNMFNISYVPETMTEKELSDLLRRSIREFYLRPAYILRQFRHIKSLTDFARYTRGFILALLR